MSELREAIKAIQIIDPHDSTVGETLTEGQLNAILDAVIAALPEEYPTSDADYDNGFNWAIGQTRSILLDAKENK